MTQQRTALRSLIAGWAALGVVLGGATQLRFAGPFGPSEGILVAWIAFVLFLLLRGLPFTVDRMFYALLTYWLASLALLCFGALVAIQLHHFNRVDATHDGAAFVYIATLTCLLALSLLDAGTKEYHLQMARMLFLFYSLAAAFLLVAAIVHIPLGPVRLWYAGVRFAGWAENPNQFSLTMVPMPFLGWYLLKRTPSATRKIAYLLGIGVCGIAGILTLSDSLRVGWAAALCAIGGLLWYRVVVRGRSRWLHISHLIIPAIVLVVGIASGDAVMDKLHDVMEGIYEDHSQGEKRFTLWLHGLQAIQTSPLVGLGPGPFSGKEGPFGGNEAHNSLIDWGMSTGVVGVMFQLALWGWCIWRTARSNSPALLGMAVSVLVLSLFGYMLRHPGYWIILLLSVSLAERRATPQGRSVLQSDTAQPDRFGLRPGRLQPGAAMRLQGVKPR